MNRLLPFLLLSLLATNRLAAQACPGYPLLMAEGTNLQAKKQYRQALNKYNAAKLCDPAKAPEVDVRICELFEAIEGEKEQAVIARNESEKSKRQAVAARKQAEAATKRAVEANVRATRQAREAKALYWASESDKVMDPEQAVGLLQEALKFHPTSRPVLERFVHRFSEIPAKLEIIVSAYTQFRNIATFSSNGEKILTYSERFAPLAIWDSDHFDKNPVNFGNSGRISSATLSPAGTKAFVVKDSTLNLLDVRAPTTPPIRIFHPHPVRFSTFHPDGRRVLTSEANGTTATLWDFNTPKSSPTVFNHGSEVIKASFSPGSWWSLTSSNHRVALWDLRKPDKPVRVFGASPEQGNIRGDFSGDGRHVLISVADTATVWTLEALGKPIRGLRLHGGSGLFRLSDDGSEIMVVEDNFRYVDVDDLNQPDAPGVRIYYDAFLSVVEEAYLVSGTIVLVGEEGICVWSLESPEQPLIFIKEETIVAFSGSPLGVRALTRHGTSETVRLRHFNLRAVSNWLNANPNSLKPLSDENRRKYGVPK